ncbi:MAG: phage holin family protein [Myxococcota bacterium]
MFRQLAGESQALARAEVALAKTELNENINKAIRGVASMVGGSAALAAGLVVLLFAAVLGLGTVIPLWLSALIIGGGIAAVGLVLTMVGAKKSKPQNLKPERTIQELKAAQDYAREKLS